MYITSGSAYSLFIKAGDYIFVPVQTGFTDVDTDEDIEGI